MKLHRPLPGGAQTRDDYERWLDAQYAAARGHCDALIYLEHLPVVEFGSDRQ